MGRHASWACGQRWAQADRLFYSFSAKPERSTSWFDAGVGWKVGPPGQAVRIKAKAVRSSQMGASSAKFPSGFQDGGTECLGSGGWHGGEKALDSIQSEFLAGMSAVGFALKDSTRHE